LFFREFGEFVIDFLQVEVRDFFVEFFR